MAKEVGAKILSSVTKNTDYFKERGEDWDPEQTMYLGNLQYDGVSRARHDITKEDVDKIRKDKPIKENWNFYGHRCNAGKDQFVIDQKGKVWRKRFAKKLGS